MSSTTQIKGNARWESCWRHACYLAQYIYSDPAPTGGFSSKFPEKIAEVQQHWEKWQEKVNQEGSGFVARLFKLKTWDPESKDPPPCPPCLVFRGTDFDDMRDLAVHVGGSVYGVNIVDMVYMLDTTNYQQVRTRQDLLDAGFEIIPVFDDGGLIGVEGANFGIHAPFWVSLSANIAVKKNGDWANNVRQALGKESRQYSSAIKYSVEIIGLKIAPLKDKRLELSGHSLGGGLASAVCAHLEHRYESQDVHFHAIVFNSTGVHPNTLSPATRSNGLIDAFAVEDEILTTLQSFSAQLPMVDPIFRMAQPKIGQNGLPTAMGTLLVKPGISPGGPHGCCFCHLILQI